MAVTQLEIARRVGLDVSSVNKILNRRPGPVFNTLNSVGRTPLISVTGHASYPAKGQLDMTTVSLSGARCAKLGPQRSAEVTIGDDDSPPEQPAAFTIGGAVDGLKG